MRRTERTNAIGGGQARRSIETILSGPKHACKDFLSERLGERVEEIGYEDC